MVPESTAARMTPRQRIRLRALGLQDDPLYWTRPVPISELTKPRTLRWQHGRSPGPTSSKPRHEEASIDTTQLGSSGRLPRLQTPISSALAELIHSLCQEEGWEASSPEASPTKTRGTSSPGFRNNVGPSTTRVRSSEKHRASSGSARVRFRDEGPETGREVPGGVGSKEAEARSPQRFQGESLNRAGESSSSGDGLANGGDAFDSLALRFQGQPVKVSREDSGESNPSRPGALGPLKNQGYQYTPHPVKGVRKSVQQPGTPFPGTEIPPNSRSPFERQQPGLQAITEADAGDSDTLRPARDGSPTASSSGADRPAEKSPKSNGGFSTTSSAAKMQLVGEGVHLDSGSPVVLTHSPGVDLHGGFSRRTRSGNESPGKGGLSRSLDRGASPERSGENVRKKRSPYLAPLRSVRSATGGAGLGSEPSDRLAQFAAYLSVQRSEVPERKQRPRSRLPGGEDALEAARGTSPGRIEQISGGVSDRRNRSPGSSRGQNAEPNSVTQEPAKAHLSGNGRPGTKPRWVIGESKVTGQYAAVLPQLGTGRGSRKPVDNGAREWHHVSPMEEWSQREERLRKLRVSKEQAWLGQSHQRMALWMQDHFEALERISHLTPNERTEAERVWSAAQAAARDHALTPKKVSVSMVTGLEEEGKIAEAPEEQGGNVENEPATYSDSGGVLI